MSAQLDLAYQTIAAELLERALDAQFDADFPESGSFKKRTVKELDYWYYKPSRRGGSEERELYVGPASDPAIEKRVQQFQSLKNDYRARRKLVSILVREARLFAPLPRVGNVVEAFWKAGPFRLRACLVGTVAYQTYGVVLGCRLPNAALQTGDIDFAQFHSISVAVDDTIPPVLEILSEIDPAMRPVPNLADPIKASSFVGADGLRVEFLTPNTGSEDHTGKLTIMPALGGASATPLRFLDFLMHHPIRTVMLHKGGIPVVVPDPVRFSIHKLIVAARRQPGTGKDTKDLRQAVILARLLHEIGRKDDLLDVRDEAVDRGPAWSEAIQRSLARLQQNDRELFD